MAMLFVFKVVELAAKSRLLSWGREDQGKVLVPGSGSSLAIISTCIGPMSRWRKALLWMCLSADLKLVPRESSGSGNGLMVAPARSPAFTAAVEAAGKQRTGLVQNLKRQCLSRIQPESDVAGILASRHCRPVEGLEICRQVGAIIKPSACKNQMTNVCLGC